MYTNGLSRAKVGRIVKAIQLDNLAGRYTLSSVSMSTITLGTQLIAFV